MKNLFNIETLRLTKEYSSKGMYHHRNVLEKFVVVAFRNNGFLPNTFDIDVTLPDSNIVNEVLTDLGYLHIRCIRCCSRTIYITIGK